MLETQLKQARQVLEDNWNGSFTQTSPSYSSLQLNWDAGFIAIGNAHFNMDRAEAELRHLFSAQWSNGLLPHAVFGEKKDDTCFPGPDFWQAERSPHAPQSVPASGITAPPVFGFVLWRIYEIAQDEKRARAFLQEMYPQVLAFHRYLYNFRDPLEEGLVYICHPWEGVIANSPSWAGALKRMNITTVATPLNDSKDMPTAMETALYKDAPEDYSRCIDLISLFRSLDYDSGAIYEQSPFLIQDPLFNGVLAWSNECLIQIGGLLGEDVSEVIEWDELTKYSINEKMWDEARGMYNAFDLRNNELIHVHTSSGLMPLIGDVPTQDQAEKILKTLESPMFGGKRNDLYNCPAYSLLAKDIDYQGFWRGSVWINLNWLLFHGLQRYEMYEMAERIRQDSLELLSGRGFCDYFDPRKGVSQPTTHEAPRSSCSAALCIDLLASN